MVSVRFADVTYKSKYDTSLLSANVLAHCKKKESLLGAVMLCEMGVCGLYYEENGKPMAENCFVSISHSGNTVAVCKSENPVGIDIEDSTRKRDFQKLANRFFGKKELEYFNTKKDAAAFYEIWTKKEAYSKITGNGTKEIFKGFDVFDLDGYIFTTDIQNDFIISTCEKV